MTNFSKNIKLKERVEKEGESMYKPILKYFEKHAVYNSAVHTLIGLGFGILLARPVIGEHPVRWALVLISIGLLGHLYPLMNKK